MTTALLAGNELPARWRDKPHFVVLDVGFGLGRDFLATWSAWRDDPERCRVLHYIAIAAPTVLADLVACPRPGAHRPLLDALVAAWPPATPDLHRLTFAGGAVQLLLAFGTADEWLTRIEARVDAFFLDDALGPDTLPAPDKRYFRSLARLAASGATALVATADRPTQAGLRSAGFSLRELASPPGPAGTTQATFAPAFAPRVPPRRRTAVASRADGSHEPVLIVGAGLAGCATACALAERGRASLIIDRCADLASEGSGNAAGLFHGVVHGADGRHARWQRAAALAAARDVGAALAMGAAGSVAGLLRLETGGSSVEDLQRTLDRLGLPADYVRAVDAAEASRLAGTTVASPGWFFAQGGWVDPRGLARAWVARAGAQVEQRLGVTVASLRQDGTRWKLADATGRTIAGASVVVLANAGGALDLLALSGWPIQRSRGQLSSLAAAEWPPGALPRLALAGAGYVVPPIAGRVWFGATSSVDGEASPRIADHEHNLARLSCLLAAAPRSAVGIEGRVAFRWRADDRLPVIGAVADVHAMALNSALEAVFKSRRARLDQPRFVPRAPGLFVITALGSRGIAGAALGGAVIASAITGAPSPVGSDLLDAVDPARFLSRAARRQPPVGFMAGGSAGA